jgi:hypothetical protein
VAVCGISAFAAVYAVLARLTYPLLAAFVSGTLLAAGGVVYARADRTVVASRRRLVVAYVEVVTLILLQALSDLRRH